MSQTQQDQSAQMERRRPGTQRTMFKLLNPLMRLMLNSPLHGRMSERVMILSFTGRKTGKHYATPVAYTRKGSEVIVVSFSPWGNNFKDPAPVQMRIQGKIVNGMARLVSDPAQIKQMVSTLMATSGRDMMQRMGLWIDNLDSASPETVQQATQGTYFIEIKTNGG